ncbi:MAG: glycine/sarcosine/betaine reductase component B subunit [Candidatus Adiutrix sp.]|jgi:hypothetical protein|nr:glycine/sarcosine/betaine reductase component B subunit [Candidatus Adiutrix sp.]
MRLELHKAKVRGLALGGPTRLENGLLRIDASISFTPAKAARTRR